VNGFAPPFMVRYPTTNGYVRFSNGPTTWSTAALSRRTKNA